MNGDAFVFSRATDIFLDKLGELEEQIAREGGSENFAVHLRGVVIYRLKCNQKPLCILNPQTYFFFAWEAHINLFSYKVEQQCVLFSFVVLD